MPLINSLLLVNIRTFAGTIRIHTSSTARNFESVPSWCLLAGSLSAGLIGTLGGTHVIYIPRKVVNRESWLWWTLSCRDEFKYGLSDSPMIQEVWVRKYINDSFNNCNTIRSPLNDCLYIVIYCSIRLKTENQDYLYISFTYFTLKT